MPLLLGPQLLLGPSLLICALAQRILILVVSVGLGRVKVVLGEIDFSCELSIVGSVVEELSDEGFELHWLLAEPTIRS